VKGTGVPSGLALLAKAEDGHVNPREDGGDARYDEYLKQSRGLMIRSGVAGVKRESAKSWLL